MLTPSPLPIEIQTICAFNVSLRSRTYTPPPHRPTTFTTLTPPLSPLPPAEAVVEHFDDDKNGYVDGAEFMVHFFKMGFQEKSAQKKWRLARAKTIQEKEKSVESKRDTAKKEWADSQVRWDYTEKDKRRGQAKLAEAALSYMRNGPRVTGIAGLKGFQGAALHPMEFRCVIVPSQP